MSYKQPKEIFITAEGNNSEITAIVSYDREYYVSYFEKINNQIKPIHPPIVTSDVDAVIDHIALVFGTEIDRNSLKKSITGLTLTYEEPTTIPVEFNDNTIASVLASLAKLDTKYKLQYFVNSLVTYVPGI